jgi:hypothetical protein
MEVSDASLEEQFPPAAQILMYGMVSLYRLLHTCRDLRRSLELANSGVTLLHPEDADGFRHRYAILEQQVMSAEATAQDLCRHLQQALLTEDGDQVGVTARTFPAVRGMWITFF